MHIISPSAQKHCTRLNTHSNKSMEIPFGVVSMGESSLASEGRLIGGKCFVPWVSALKLAVHFVLAQLDGYFT